MINLNNNYSLTLARVEQASDIAQVVNTAYGAQFNQYIVADENHPIERTSPEKVKALMSEKANQLYVLVDQSGSVKGTICYVKRENKNSGYFGMFSLAVEAQKGGIGAKMIDHVEKEAKLEGKTRMKIDVSGFAAGLHKYYGSKGYQDLGKTITWSNNIHWKLAPQYEQDSRSAFIVMKKTLS